MEFKKINDRRFQCRLDEEDLEDNNISLDDFFKNDTDKIHSLLEVIMEEAEKNIGVTLSGEVMSLQLAPQPDHSILLTVSSGKEDLGNMLRKAGESISKAFSKPEKSNVIKNGEGTFKDAPFETFGDSLDKFELPDAQTDELKKTGQKKKASNVIKAGCGVFRLESLNDFEEMCTVSSRTWGITNALYKNKEDDTYYPVFHNNQNKNFHNLLTLNVCEKLFPIVSEIIERANYTNEIQVNDVEMYASFCIYGQLGIILKTDISIKEKSSRIKAFFRDLFRL